jgi:NitT/TauT family transport system substrate-binding protein
LLGGSLTNRKADAEESTGPMMKRDMKRTVKRALATAAIIFPLFAAEAAFEAALAADKVVVVMGKTSSNLPYYVADARGYFKELGIEPEQKIVVDNSLVVTALIADQAEAAAAVLAIDGMNANIKKPGTVNWITLNAQNDPHKMEQFVIRTGFKATTLADLKGARIACAPGLGNLSMARAALAKAGLSEGDYKLDPMDPNQHINVLQSGQYDAAYTLEPGATVMRKAGVATTLQSGVIAQVVLGDPKADAYVGGAVVTGTFAKNRPEVAKRYAQAWSKAIKFIRDSSDEARKYLVGNTPIPENIVADVPLVLFTYAADATDKDKANLQAYLDYAVNMGVLSEKVSVAQYIKAY